MPRKYNDKPESGYTILLVDDDPEYLEATRLLLEREGHRVQTASSGADALARLRERPVDLLLLDYYMPGMTGEQVVTELRQFNPYVQIVLQTGYASEQPSRDLLKRLDIQGYHDKSEGPERLLLWTDVGLRSASTIQSLNKSRLGMRYILDVTPDLHRIQPVNDLYQGILLQCAGLLGAVNVAVAFPAGSPLLVRTDGFLATWDGTEWVIRASSGRFLGQQDVEGCIGAERMQSVHSAVLRGEIQTVDETTVIPLRFGELTLGVIYVESPAVGADDRELLRIYANQAAVAIENMQLYEMATMDPLTGVYTRRFFDLWLLRSLRSALRSRLTLSLLMLDLDSLKQLNDLAGHLAGDQALASLGTVLRDAMRGSDIHGRFGGDEFAVILPQTSEDEAVRVGQRIIELLGTKRLNGSAGAIPIRVSMGVAALNAFRSDAEDIPHPIPDGYFEAMAQALIQRTDDALYRAKTSGGNQICKTTAIEWQPFDRNVAATS